MTLVLRIAYPEFNILTLISSLCTNWLTLKALEEEVAWSSQAPAHDRRYHKHEMLTYVNIYAALHLATVWGDFHFHKVIFMLRCLLSMFKRAVFHVGNSRIYLVVPRTFVWRRSEFAFNIVAYMSVSSASTCISLYICIYILCFHMPSRNFVQLFVKFSVGKIV